MKNGRPSAPLVDAEERVGCEGSAAIYGFDHLREHLDRISLERPRDGDELHDFDAAFTKAHVRWIESRLIRLVQNAGAATLANGTDPVPPPLPEADQAGMMFFIDQLRLVLPMLGFDLFRRPLSATPSSQQAEASTATQFTFATAGAAAQAVETDEGFIVLAGLTARRNPSATFPAGYLALRDQLMDAGQLVEGTDP